MNYRFDLPAAVGLALGISMSVASAGPIRSVGVMTFADAPQRSIDEKYRRFFSASLGRPAGVLSQDGPAP
jgi:hypothetical protein